MTISRRHLLGGALAAPFLAGCSQPEPRLLTYNGPPVTGVVVNKAARQMVLLSGSSVLRQHRVDLGNNPVGPKRWEGDGRTPEGLYVVDKRNPQSEYHLSVGISYPNAQDVAYAAALGLLPGGNIFFHGTPPEEQRGTDWTAGCMAVSNPEIEEIYAMVRDGTPVQINP